MTKRHFGEMRRAQEARGKFLCIGLDIDLRKMPISFRAGGNAERAIRNFGCFLVEQTRDIIFAPDPREAACATRTLLDSKP